MSLKVVTQLAKLMPITSPTMVYCWYIYTFLWFINQRSHDCRGHHLVLCHISTAAASATSGALPSPAGEWSWRNAECWWWTGPDAGDCPVTPRWHSFRTRGGDGNIWELLKFFCLRHYYNQWINIMLLIVLFWSHVFNIKHIKQYHWLSFCT